LATLAVNGLQPPKHGSGRKDQADSDARPTLALTDADASRLCICSGFSESKIGRSHLRPLREAGYSVLCFYGGEAEADLLLGQLLGQRAYDAKISRNIKKLYYKYGG
jgi:hypothetical protein